MTNQYRTDYSYDLNGNIEWLNRRNGHALVMENGNEANNFANYVATPSAVAAKSGTHVFRSSNTVNGGLGIILPQSHS